MRERVRPSFVHCREWDRQPPSCLGACRGGPLITTTALVSVLAILVSVGNASAEPLSGPEAPTPQLAQSGPENGSVTERTFDIPGQPLSSALLQFGDQSGLQLAVDTGTVAGIRTGGVRGTYSPEEALQVLLSGTGLLYRFAGPNAVTLRSAPTNGDDALVLDPIVVADDRSADSPGASVRAAGPSTTVMTEEDLARSNSSRMMDAIRNTPNVTPATGEFLPPIRGTDSGGPNGLGGSLQFASSPRASLVVDGVSRPQNIPNNAYQSLFDVEQVEVRRGPQLSGAGPSAISGAYVVKTKDPVYDMAGAIELGVDWNEVSDAGYEGAAMVNGEILKDEIATRLVVQYEKGRIPVEVYDDGTAPAGTDFQERSEFDTLTVRNKLLVEPNALPDLTALLTAEYQQGTDIGFDSFVNGTEFGCCEAESRKYAYASQQRIFDTEAMGGTLDLRYALGDVAEVRSLTSFQRSDFDDNPISNSSIEFKKIEREAFSQDLTYGYGDADSPYSVLLGISYSLESEFADADGFDLNTEGEKSSVAGIIDATAEVMDGVRVFGGGRAQFSKSTHAGDAFAGAGQIKVDQRDLFFLPRAGVSVDVAKDHTVTASVRRGFNYGGGGVDFSTLQTYEFDPEFVWTFELGHEGDLLDGKAAIKTAIFYNIYKDYQFSYRPDPNTNRVLNFDGTSVGAEIEGEAELVDALQASLAVGLLHTRIDEPGDNIDGNRFGTDPHLTVTVGLLWEPIRDLALDATLTYVSDYHADFTETAGMKSGDYFNLDLGATYTHGSLKARAFVRNATDALQYYSRSNVAGGGYLMPPREVGLKLTASF